MKTTFKKTTRILFLTLAAMLSVMLTQAQPGGQKGGQQGPPPIPTDKQIETMVSDLAGEVDLSTAQETKVLELYKTHFAEVKEKTSGNSRPDREEMETQKKAFEKQVKAELTKEQTSKYEAYLKEQSKQQPPQKEK
ncbi:MAG: hypothetical protein EOM83_02820 [Clostridia bacterium]|nr:hypothetical protein [Clostridia bacterium]